MEITVDSARSSALGRPLEGLQIGETPSPSEYVIHRELIQLPFVSKNEEVEKAGRYKVWIGFGTESARATFTSFKSIDRCHAVLLAQSVPEPIFSESTPVLLEGPSDDDWTVPIWRVASLSGLSFINLIEHTTPGDTAVHESRWSDAKNDRRCRLIDKEIEGELSIDERRELARLQDEMLAFRRHVAPLPLDDLRELHQELLRDLASGDQIE